MPIVCRLLHYGQIKYRVLQVGTALACSFILTIHFGMNKHFLFQSYMYCSHSLHIFPNYIVNMVVCICWIIADYLGAVHKLFGFPARILYGRPTHMEVYHAAHTFLGG